MGLRPSWRLIWSCNLSLKSWWHTHSGAGGVVPFLPDWNPTMLPWYIYQRNIVSTMRKCRDKSMRNFQIFQAMRKFEQKPCVNLKKRTECVEKGTISQPKTKIYRKKWLKNHPGKTLIFSLQMTFSLKFRPKMKRQAFFLENFTSIPKNEKNV